MYEKYELLQETARGLSNSSLFGVFGAIIVCLTLIFPKIYLANNIYYESQRLEKQRVIALILEDENHRLRQKIEKIEFINDTRSFAR